jgi:hemoglobin/transferrin/lactoferrin receptor protein
MVSAGILMVACPGMARAQEADIVLEEVGIETERGVLDLPEAIITATWSSRTGLDVPYSSDLITEQMIEERLPRTLPQLLLETPGVLVQETAPGHGSPYIRGFTSFRNLFLVDGIRLNNSVFRPGPNQYWNTVDPYSLEAVEVIKGPSSVLYGSDAIGGTVQALTKKPYLGRGGSSFGGMFQYRFGSSQESNIARAEASTIWAGGSTGLLMGVTAKDYGDLRGGEDTGIQRNTAYSELDADLKFERFLDPNTRFSLGFQHVYQNDVPRTHKTSHAVPFEGTTVGSDRRRDLDQERTLVDAQLRGEEVSSFFDRYQLSLSWQEQSEKRHRTKESGSKEEQGFDVGTLGLLANLSSNTDIGRLTYGLDFYLDSVDSFKDGQPIQGPVADDASYELLGVFLQDEIEVSERLELILGARFNYAAADADSVLDPVTSTQTSISESWNAWVGSARFLYELEEDSTNLYGGVSQGFRAPNLSDLTRLDSARTNEFEIPSPGLDPERSISYELGVKTQQESVSAEVAVFHTEIHDQIVLFPTGNTNADGEFEITKENVGEGFVQGVEFGAAWEFVPRWTLFGNATYQYGKVETYPTSAQELEDEYLSRLMPFSGQLGIRWDDESGRVWVEALGLYADDADKLSTRDKNDTSRIPPGGTPSYLVLHLRGGWQVNEALSVHAGVENVTDEDYRVHGSGHNMPGLGVVLGLRLTL